MFTTREDHQDNYLKPYIQAINLKQEKNLLLKSKKYCRVKANLRNVPNTSNISPSQRATALRLKHNSLIVKILSF